MLCMLLQQWESLLVDSECRVFQSRIRLKPLEPEVGNCDFRA